MAIGDDFSVTVSGDIRHTSGTTNYTVLELHRWLQDLADDQQASGNDLVDITSDTPSERSTDNIITLNSPYNIDDDAAEYFYAGSITQDGGDTVYSGLQVLGSVNTNTTQLMILQDTGLYQFTTTPSAPFWGDQTSPYNGGGSVLMRILVKSRVNGVDIDGKRIKVTAREWGDSYDFFSVTLGQGESVAAIGTTPDAQNDTAQGTVTAYTHIVNSGGTANAPTGGYQTIDLNNGNGAREYYSAWTFGADTSGDGLKGMYEYHKDLVGEGSTKTVDGLDGEVFFGISHQIPYTAQSGNFTERETLVWGTEITYDTLVSGPFTPGNLVTIGASGASGRVNYDDGVSQLWVSLDDTSITLLDGDVITEFSGPGAAATTTTAAINVTIAGNGVEGGTGVLLADGDDGATGDAWIQLMTGEPPVNTAEIIGATSTSTATASAPTVRTVSKLFTGSYTGTLIGAYGLGVDAGDLTDADTIEDLTSTTQQPPNNVTFSVTGLVSGDYCLVGPRTGITLNKAQDTINGTLTDGTSATVVTTTAIPTDTPTAAGSTIRIQDDNGVYVRIPYQSYTGSTYTLTGQGTGFFEGSDNSNATTGNEIFISYIDVSSSGGTESFTSVPS
jgi:hypothetical protein